MRAGEEAGATAPDVAAVIMVATSPEAVVPLPTPADAGATLPAEGGGFDWRRSAPNSIVKASWRKPPSPARSLLRRMTLPTSIDAPRRCSPRRLRRRPGALHRGVPLAQAAAAALPRRRGRVGKTESPRCWRSPWPAADPAAMLRGAGRRGAVYEWNYAGQMMAIRLAEAGGAVDRERLESELFSERYLIRRPLLQALEPGEGGAPVLLIDELDRTDEAFEASCSKCCPTSRSRSPNSARSARPSRRW